MFMKKEYDFDNCLDYESGYGYDYETESEKYEYNTEDKYDNDNYVREDVDETFDENDYFDEPISDYNSENEIPTNLVSSVTNEFEKESIRESFVKIMDKYHNGSTQERQKALADAIGLLDGFVHLIIKRSYYTYAKKYFSDLLQEGYLGIVIGMEKYNPELSMPTTFFFPYIKHEMQGFITKNVDKTTSHYSANIRKINKAIDVFEKNNKQYTNVDIAIQTGMTIETVNQSMAIRNYRNEVHIDGCPGSVIDDKSVKKVQTPEEAYMEKEQSDIIQRSIINTLTENEIKVLEMRFGINNKKILPEGEIAKILHVPKDKVKKLLNSAIRKLKDSEMGSLFKDRLAGQRALIEESCISFVPKEIAELEIEQMEAIEISF